jgi:hypothetical protein
MTVKVEPIGTFELEQRLKQFESRFAMPSSEFVEAFRNGQLQETEEFREWSMLYAAWELASRRQSS